MNCLGTLSPASTSIVPTVTDNLFSQGLIPTNQVGISLEPATAASVTNGELTWGGTDSTKFTGSITYTWVKLHVFITVLSDLVPRPITTVATAKELWGIDQSIGYGTSTPILSTASGIVGKFFLLGITPCIQ
jgi:cathepsin E